MLYAKPNREPDYIYKANEVWFKEMLMSSHRNMAPIMECPVSHQIMVYRPTGWYAVASDITRQYEIWLVDNILLETLPENGDQK